MLALNREPQTVTIYDAKAETLVRVLPVGEDVEALCVGLKSGMVYCANWGGPLSPESTVTVIDPAGEKVAATLVVGKEPKALCYNPKNDRIYCACSWDNKVAVIDAANNKVLALLTAGEIPYALALIRCATGSIARTRVRATPGLDHHHH